MYKNNLLYVLTIGCNLTNLKICYKNGKQNCKNVKMANIIKLKNIDTLIGAHFL